MDWGALLSRIGNAGDVLAGSESTASIRQKRDQTALARERTAMEAHNAARAEEMAAMAQRNQLAAQEAGQVRGIQASALEGNKSRELQQSLALQASIDAMLRQREAQKAAMDLQGQRITGDQMGMFMGNSLRNSREDFEYGRGRQDSGMNYELPSAVAAQYGLPAGATVGALQGPARAATLEYTVKNPGASTQFNPMQDNSSILNLLGGLSQPKQSWWDKLTGGSPSVGPSGMPMTIPKQAPELVAPNPNQPRKGNY